MWPLSEAGSDGCGPCPAPRRLGVFAKSVGWKRASARSRQKAGSQRSEKYWPGAAWPGDYAALPAGALAPGDGVLARTCGLATLFSTCWMSQRHHLVHMPRNRFFAFLSLPLPTAVPASPSTCFWALLLLQCGCGEQTWDFNSRILWSARSACEDRLKSNANEHKCFSHNSSQEKELINRRLTLNLCILKYLFPKALQGQLWKLIL